MSTLPKVKGDDTLLCSRFFVRITMRISFRGYFPTFFWYIREGLYWGFLVFLGSVLGLVGIYFAESTDVTELLNRKLSETSVLYDRTGTVVLYELHGEENRTIVRHEDIPDVMRHAIIAAEDKSFYDHMGIDPPSILRAAWKNFQSDRIEQGASTITQQLARIAFLSREKTFIRKIREGILALKIERTFSKDEILDLYLNTVPFGSNAYGIERASRSFFGKSAQELTLDEAALLAALPRATAHYSPYGNNRSALRARQRAILIHVEEYGLATPFEVRRALNVNTFAKLREPESPIRAPHFVFAVIDELEKQYGRAFLETRGLSIRTTLDLDLQKDAEEAVRAGVARNAAFNAENAALIATDVHTGDVLALVGSRDYFDTRIDGQVNVTLRPRQPGSSFKPFAYARAFEEGYEPETMLFDVPTNFGPDGSGKDYIPKNYDGRYRGMLPMKEALPQSLNIPAVQTLSVVGVPDVIELASRLGISTLRDGRPYGLALVLGGAEVLPADMAEAFGSFASEGIRRERRMILSIHSLDGTIREDSPVREYRVLNSEVARKINTILSDNALRARIFGYNSPLNFPKGTVAAKTGTTQNFHDAWTVGYTKDIAVAVWTGNNDNRPMKAGADGVFVAAPLWRDFMNRALLHFPPSSFAPYTVVKTDPFSLASRFGRGTSFDTSFSDDGLMPWEYPEKRSKKKKR